MVDEKKRTGLSRRGFMKTAALAGVATALPVTGIGAKESPADKTIFAGSRPSPEGKKRTLVFMSANPEDSEKVMQSIRSIKDYDINVIPVANDFKNPENVIPLAKGKNADILFVRLPGVDISTSNIAGAMGRTDIPVLLLPTNLDIIMWETDLAALLRMNGTNALVAESADHAVQLVKILSAPRILEGKKALIFGKPFSSISVPVSHLSEEYVYNQTGVRIKYRPVEELRELIKGVDEAEARKEMERWKKDASQIIDVSDEIILRSSRMSLLISSLVRKEGLEGISVDCLSYSFSQDTSIPLPCLAFTRLRDQGISAACEADVCMMLSSMVMQDLTKRPSFQSNVSSLNIPDSSTVVRHCVVPTRIYGTEGPQVKYNLRDYHGMGKGAVPEIEFPEGLDVTMGGFTKDLKEFVLWPGRIKKTLYDMDTPSFPDAPPEFQKMRKYCSVKAEVKVKKIRQFAQNIAGVHHILVTGSHFEDIQNAMMRMNVRLVSPDDKVPPEV